MGALGEDIHATEQTIVAHFRAERSDLAQIHDVFTASQYADRLGDMPLRFAQKHNFEDAFSRNEFLHILGIDVDHITHPIKQWHVGRLMLKGVSSEAVTPEQAECLEVTAVLHDFGEAATVAGDIAYADKTDEDETEEVRALSVVLRELYGDQNLFEYIEPALNPQTEVGKIFKLAERVGYAQTQIRAWKYQREYGDQLSANQINSCLSLASDYSFHHPHMDKARTTFPYVDDFLITHREMTSSILKLPPAEEIQHRSHTLVQ